MGAFARLGSLDRQRIWAGIHARMVHGERMTLGVVELDPGAAAPEHAHAHEQVGLVLSGSVRFTIGDETRELRQGDVYVIPSDVSHTAEAGPEGTALIDVFSPVREEWRAAETAEPAEPRWPT
ncbi:MAG: cupin domain-containing protein [Actinobacteria bacterium]|nr:cupin domain-containing protein [Actinomycetota bacterium]